MGGVVAGSVAILIISAGAAVTVITVLCLCRRRRLGRYCQEYSWYCVLDIVK